MAETLREKIAEHAHSVWQRWAAYMFTHLEDDACIKRWKRQAGTKYADLPQGEKESDMAIAEEYLDLLKAELDKLTVMKIDPHAYYNPFDAKWGAGDQLAHTKEQLKELLG